MGTDADWDALLDLEAEVAILDEEYVYRALGKIDKLANDAALTLPAELRKPLLAIMAYAQEARKRLIDG